MDGDGAARPQRRGLTILGAYGGYNSGDEMILRAVAGEARRAGYRGTINVVCGRVPPAPALTADYEARGLRPVGWRNPARAARAALGRDLFIGGGQIVDGVAGIQFPMVKLGLAAVAKASGGRTTIGGVSTARLDRPAVRRAYDAVFRLSDRIAARDAASTADILAITPSARSKATTLADMVFSLEDDLRGSQPPQERRTLAFAVHHGPDFHHTAFDDTLAFLRRVLAASAGRYPIAILAHDMRDDWDLGLARRLADALASPEVTPLTLATTDQCIAFYKTARTVISARMHPIILGACAGGYCVPLASSRKVADMAEKLELPQWSLAELAALPDDAFARAIGLDVAGPSASTAAIERLASQARQVFGPTQATAPPKR